MTVKRSGLAAALLVLSSSYCYSEVINGLSNNAAQNGLTWQMTPLLPSQTGLTVGGVFYRYTIEKDPTADSQVHIQNQNAIDGGLLYRNTDDWSGLPGNTIVSRFMLPNIPLQYFGNGSIEVEGNGTIKDATIIYSYTYDTCADPISDASCPGYASAMYQYLLDNGLLNNEVSISNPLDDEFIQAALNREVERNNEENNNTGKKEEQEKEIDLEEALAAADNAIAIAEGAASIASLSATADMNQFNIYLQTNIPGGVYNDRLQFEPKDIPENRQALRVGLAQQLLHEQMVNSQYQLGNATTNNR
jgi:hypothetical protein